MVSGKARAPLAGFLGNALRQISMELGLNLEELNILRFKKDSGAYSGGLNNKLWPVGRSNDFFVVNHVKFFWPVLPEV